MTPPRTAEQLDAGALARRHRETLLRRTRRIRRSVAGLALALFAVAFLVISVQLASGHDPALVANAARRAEAAEAATESSGAGESTTSAGTSSGGSEAANESSGETSSESSSSEVGESSAGASAMTTSQS